MLRRLHPLSGPGEPVASTLGGTIMRILVQPGDAVEEGEVLLTMEAMKMKPKSARSNRVGD